MRVIYIGGASRSGTTLVDRILGELPGVCSLGEVVNVWQRGVRADEECGCGQPFSACEFWTAVGDTAFGGWNHVDADRVLALRPRVERLRHIPRLARGQLTCGQLAQVTEYAGYYAQIYSAAARVTGAPVLVDSSKRAMLAFCLRWLPDLDLRAVHLLRDPRGVAYSLTKRVSRLPAPGSSSASPAASMGRARPGRSALLWNAHNVPFELLGRLGRRGRRPVPRAIPVRRLRYEDFLAEPARAVRDLAAFAGLDVSAADLSYLDGESARLGVVHSASGNPMRFTTGRIPLRRDDAWRQALPATQRRLVGAVCAPLLAMYGYPLLCPPPRSGSRSPRP